MNKTRLERLMARVEKTDSCWIWRGAMTKNGYGVAYRSNKSRPRVQVVHRQVYELMVGPIAPGLDIDHLCRVRACCNPEHLEAVTRGDNLSRGAGSGGRFWRRPTHCVQGHEFTPENTRQSPRQRFCLTCERAAGARYRLRRKGIAA